MKLTIKRRNSQETTKAASIAETTKAAADNSDFGVFSEIAGKDGVVYQNLFEVILDKKYDDYWVEKCASLIGEEKAAETVEMLKASISGDIYGQKAIDAYTEAPEKMGFDCWYIHDAKTFEFKNDEITTTKTDGTAETHTYQYLGAYKIGTGETMNYGGKEIDPSFSCDVYQSTDDAGEFTYFFMRDDTMDTTYHISSAMEAIWKHSRDIL